MRFDSYHPMINLIYFVAAIGLTLCFNHPVFLAISYLCAFAYSVKLNGHRAVIFNLCIVPVAIAHALWYAYYNHFGVTPLAHNFTGNQITLEALAYGLVISFQVAAAVMFMSCVFAIFSSDKAVYLFGKVSPKLSLFLSISLRTIPRMKKYAGRINTAQKGIGRSPAQGNVVRRAHNLIRLLSTLITWTMENFVESSQSMKCRGYSLKGRTAFSIYRFDNRDRGFVIAIFFLITVVLMGWALNQTNIYYDPQIIACPITWVSYLFYLAYGVLLLLPMILQVAGERKFARLVRQMP